QQPMRGLVTDETGIPLLGASVTTKGTSNGVTTDFDGNITIAANKGDVLQVTYVGFKTYEVTIENQTNLTIQMSANTSILDEVVVVGYGTQRKGNLTGAVGRSEEHTSELQSRENLVCRLLLEKK